MKTLRKKILSKLASKPKLENKIPLDSQDFAAHVLNHTKLQKYLSEKAFSQMEQSIKKGTSISVVLADQIAAAMKAWALTKGATHYTHWFQPLTGTTAEKHDSFFDLDEDGKPLEKFEGEQLVQQIPDFPNLPATSIRNTFEARG